MKILDMSGGSTAGIGLASAALIANNANGNFDVISGVSAGALNVVPIALGTATSNNLMDFWGRFELSDLWNRPPIKPDGGITFSGKIDFIKAIVFNKHYVAKMDALRKSIAKVVSEEKFKEAKAGPFMTSTSVDMNTGGRIVFNYNEMNHEEFIEAVVTSATIPWFGDGLHKAGFLLDGGLRDHAMGANTIEIFSKDNEIKEFVGIFSRPENPMVEPMEKMNLLSVLFRSIEIMQLEISKNDERQQRNLFRQKGIVGTQIFLPKIMQSIFDTDKARMLDLELQSGKAAVVEIKKHKERVQRKNKKARKQQHNQDIANKNNKKA